MYIYIYCIYIYKYIAYIYIYTYIAYMHIHIHIYIYIIVYIYISIINTFLLNRIIKLFIYSSQRLSYDRKTTHPVIPFGVTDTLGLPGA